MLDLLRDRKSMAQAKLSSEDPCVTLSVVHSMRFSHYTLTWGIISTYRWSSTHHIASPKAGNSFNVLKTVIPSGYMWTVTEPLKLSHKKIQYNI